MGLNPTDFRIDGVEPAVGKELTLDLLTQMVNRLFQLVDGSNVIGNLQAKLPMTFIAALFHQSIY